MSSKRRKILDILPLTPKGDKNRSITYLAMSGVCCQICYVFPEFVFANHYEICQGLQMYFLFSFVFCRTVKGNKIEHLPHAGADAVAVVALELGGGEVGSCMSNHVIVDKVIISR